LYQWWQFFRSKAGDDLAIAFDIWHLYCLDSFCTWAYIPLHRAFCCDTLDWQSGGAALVGRGSFGKRWRGIFHWRYGLRHGPLQVNIHSQNRFQLHELLTCASISATETSVFLFLLRERYAFSLRLHRLTFFVCSWLPFFYTLFVIIIYLANCRCSELSHNGRPPLVIDAGAHNGWCSCSAFLVVFSNVLYLYQLFHITCNVFGLPCACIRASIAASACFEAISVFQQFWHKQAFNTDSVCTLWCAKRFFTQWSP